MGDTMRDRVERGAALMDEANPNWCMGVSLHRLNMLNCTECVLGQMYGHYCDGLNVLLPRSIEHTGMYGFSLLDDEFDVENPATRLQLWRDLKAEWERAIVLRRSRRDGWTRIEGDTNGKDVPASN